MSQTGKSRCRFVLSNIKESLFQDDDAYSIFEPSIGLEIKGTNVFESVGFFAIENSVIMHSLENFLKETLGMVKGLKSGSASEHRYRFLGTGFSLALRRNGTMITILLEVDSRWGPVQHLSYPHSTEVGKVTVRDWVQAVVALGSELFDLFQRLNPRVYEAMTKQGNQVQELRGWLAS